MLNQIFFIYRDDFVCKLVEKMAADEGIKCYTMSTVEENFGYILDDISPQLVIIDQVSWDANSSLIGESLETSSSSFKSCILYKEKELEGFDFKLKLPIKVESFIKELKAFSN